MRKFQVVLLYSERTLSQSKINKVGPLLLPHLQEVSTESVFKEKLY